ncbi:PREDICTED: PLASMODESMATA CALLOSE-BINDING PROTEIN 3 [Nelumbo nucifera]|uniref:X8 domain-containing protein n=2 Tax=Nelumbo nucifera TaxID=4432 RepID=A0A822XYD3_NELNU|nr:PREDICTED: PLASMODESMATA CALLOSE-BINDING PROTEIN 3 [Nelumbo nucifera]DAD24006.1 TPA_asm: hypothetical protein HUJ06_025469 [Nelumbo nucifera]
MATEVEVAVVVMVVVAIMGMGGRGGVEGANWCVARSNASSDVLQTALDYACGAGADCTPIQSSGLCYLPNTIQAHASYAFNSYYQHKAMAPGSCDFAGTATVAMTDPSYGSCVYPSSTSTAGAGGTSPLTSTTTTPTGNTPYTPATTPATPGTNTPIYGGVGGLTPGLGPAIPSTDDSKASSIRSFITTTFLPFSLLLLFFL